MNYVNGCCIDSDMIRMHAGFYDNCVFGTIILNALGIRAACTTFCESKRCDGKYVLSWVCDNGDEYTELYSEEEILNAVHKVKIVIEAV